MAEKHQGVPSSSSKAPNDAARSASEGKAATIRKGPASPSIRNGRRCCEDRDTNPEARRYGSLSKRAARTSPERERSRQRVARPSLSPEKCPLPLRARVSPGASWIAISDEYSYAIVIRHQCIDVIPIVDGEATGPPVGED
eukprot:IDg16161t1